MSADEPVSPRTKISKWLFKATEDSVDSIASACEDQSRAIRQSIKRRRKASIQPARPSRIPQSTTCVPPANNNQAVASAHDQNHDISQAFRNQSQLPCVRRNVDEARESTESSKPRQCGIAVRLGLQGPFRGFGNEEGPDFGEAIRPNKRRRRPLSSSSDLQPATLDDLETKHQEIDQAAPAKTPEMNVSLLSYDSDHSIMPFSSPKQVERTYTRRSRHKTREDHYEVQTKKGGKTKKEKKERATRATKKTIDDAVGKRRKKMKSGGVLMHDFNAPNIANERLTLRPGMPSGLFGHGRASSPVKRKALPDLTFPELAFLNRSRQDVRDRHDNKKTKEDEKRTSRKAKNVIDTEANISHYFKAHRAQKVGDRNVVLAMDGPGRKIPGSIKQGPSSNSLHPPDNSFLGFGTSGANSISPVEMTEDLDARCVSTMSRRDTRSLSRGSSNYFSWSPSNAPRSAAAAAAVLQQNQQGQTSEGRCRSPLRGVKLKSRTNEIIEDHSKRSASGPKSFASRVVDDIAEMTANGDFPDTRSTVHLAEVDGINVIETPSKKELTDSAEGSRLATADAENVIEPVTDSTANVPTKVMSRAQGMLPTDPSVNTASFSQKDCEYLKRIIDTLLHAHKTRLSDNVEIQPDANSRVPNEEVVLSKDKMHPHQVKDVETAAAVDASASDYPRSKKPKSQRVVYEDGQPTIIQQFSQLDDADQSTSLLSIHRKPADLKRLPPVSDPGPVSAEDVAATPIHHESTLNNLEEDSGKMIDSQICTTTGTKIPFGSNPNAPKHEARQTEADGRHRMDTNFVQSSDPRFSSRSTTYLPATSTHARAIDGDPAIDVLREEYRTLEEYLASDVPPLDDFLVFREDGRDARFSMHSPDIDNFINNQAHDYHPSSMDFQLPEQQEFLQQHSQHQDILSMAHEDLPANAKFNYFPNLDRRPSNRRNPTTTITHTGYPDLRPKAHSFAHYSHNRGGEAGAGHDPEGFWKPNKLY